MSRDRELMRIYRGLNTLWGCSSVCVLVCMHARANEYMYMHACVSVSIRGPWVLILLMKVQNIPRVWALAVGYWVWYTDIAPSEGELFLLVSLQRSSPFYILHEQLISWCGKCWNKSRVNIVREITNHLSVLHPNVYYYNLFTEKFGKCLHLKATFLVKFLILFGKNTRITSENLEPWRSRVQIRCTTACHRRPGPPPPTPVNRTTDHHFRHLVVSSSKLHNNIAFKIMLLKIR